MKKLIILMGLLFMGIAVTTANDIGDGDNILWGT